jgi:hypothetical protein
MVKPAGEASKPSIHNTSTTLDPMTKHPFDLIIGLDRSDAQADLVYVHPATSRRWTQTLDTAPERLHDWLAGLRQEYPQARVALCLEQPPVNLILFLEAYSWITLFPINPITLQKFREAFVTSRAKNDGKDADYLAELVLSHSAKLRPWAPEDAQTRRLQQLVTHRRAVVNERTGLTNRLQALLKQYFPQALELAGEELWRPLATAFLLRWPSLQAVQKAKPGELKSFYYLQQRSRGAAHHTAVRALAFKWQRVIFRCWKNREAYDDPRYEKTLRRRHSPIVPLLKEIQLGKYPVTPTPK